MRLGIMEMQMEALIPKDVAPQEVAAQIAGFDHAGLVRRLAAASFRLIELGGDLMLFFPHAYAPEAIARLAQAKAELDLHFSVHLPLWSLETSTPLTPVRQGSVQAVEQIIAATRSLDPEVYVLHATGALAEEFYHMELPESARKPILGYFQQCAAASIRAILAETGLPGRKLAIETVGFPFELTLELAEQLDLSLCLDTGHVLAGFSGPVGLFEALESMLPRLGEVHLHDATWQGPEQHIAYGSDHRPLGTGDLDLGRLLDRLEQAHFEGPVIMELRVAEALASLQYIRKVRPSIALSA